MTQRRRSSDATSDRFTSSLAAILAVLVALSAACGNSGRTPAGKRQFDAVAPQAVRVGGAGAGALGEQMEPAPAPPPPPPQAAAPTTAPGSVAVPTARKVIRNGGMRLEVATLDEALAALREVVASSGGYLGGESRSQIDGQARQATVTCRIPAEKLDAAIERLRALGREEGLDLTADDITEQYFDLEVRLRTQQQLEARLKELLSRSTNDLSDLLDIEREVARVRGEIDQLTGRKRLWDQQVAISTLMVTLHEPVPLVASEDGGVWRTLRNAFRQAADNFVVSIAEVIAATGGLIPLIAALALVFWIVRALWRRSRRAKAPLA